MTNPIPDETSTLTINNSGITRAAPLLEKDINRKLQIETQSCICLSSSGLLLIAPEAQTDHGREGKKDAITS